MVSCPVAVAVAVSGNSTWWIGLLVRRERYGDSVQLRAS